MNGLFFDMIKFDREFFDIEKTLFCGQLFRFKPYLNGYLVFSENKSCYLFYDGDKTVVDSDFDSYFFNYFDLDLDYAKINDFLISYNIPVLTSAVENGRGLRVLKQSVFEVIFSFIISQNNNIPRIKRAIEALSENLGEKISDRFLDFFAFPKIQTLADYDVEFYKKLGLGYRADYILSAAKRISEGFDFNRLNSLSTADLRKELISFKGIGQKVADCILLFGFSRFDSFPVDTWIEKMYRKNFGLTKNRTKISVYLSQLFGNYSGFAQQFLFFNTRGM